MFPVTTTLYDEFKEGQISGLAIFILLMESWFNHWYEIPPLAEIVILSPKQIDASLDVTIIGKSFTKTWTVSLLEQLFRSVPVTIYSVRFAGYTRGLKIVLLVILIFGVHK